MFDVDKLQELARSEYQPTEQELRPTPFTRYRRKDHRSGDLAELYHENSKMTDAYAFESGKSVSLFTDEREVLLGTQCVEPDYATAESIELPEPGDLDAPVGTVLRRRESTRQFAGTALSLSELSTLLAYGCGTSRRTQILQEPPVETSSRTYPSPGGLYPTEIYLALPRGTDELEAGLYYYVPDDHLLRVLDADLGEASQLRDLFVDDAVAVDDASAVFFLTGSFWRTKAKYGIRGYRLALQEGGHLAQNLLLVATALGLGAVPHMNTHDRDVESFLGVDGVDKSLTYTVTVGEPAQEETDE